jgi:hypothetical protein
MSNLYVKSHFLKLFKKEINLHFNAKSLYQNIAIVLKALKKIGIARTVVAEEAIQFNKVSSGQD